MDVTAPLKNGDRLPDHPANTTALKIVKFGKVYDSEDGVELGGGLHASELACLMDGNQMALGHTYYFTVRNGKIYHTRASVVIACFTEPIDDPVVE